MIKTYQFVTLLGVSKFKFRVLFPDGLAKTRLIREFISGEDLANAQYELINASKGNKTVVEITQPCMYAIPGRHNLPYDANQCNAFKEACPCGTIAAYIDSNGNVKYCLFDEKILGNVCDDLFLTIWNSVLAKEVRNQRCPLDRAGNNCSSFRLLYTQFGDYQNFLKAYIKGVKDKNI